MTLLLRGTTRPASWSIGLIVLLALSWMSTEGAVSVDWARCCKCEDLMPLTLKGKPQTMPSPFKIELPEGKDVYEVNRPIKVTLMSSIPATFNSFMLGAYQHNDSRKEGLLPAFGSFKFMDGSPGYRVEDACPSSNIGNSYAAVFSKANTPTRKVTFHWTPLEKYGPIEFRATFIHNDTHYWVRERSRILYDDPSEVPIKRNAQTNPINTQQCGKSKGCYRVPDGCSEPQCYFIFTWKSHSDMVEFELGGLTDGYSNSYVAAALSDDTYVGDDVVFVCAHSYTYNTTEIYLGKHNDEYETKIEKKYLKEWKKDTKKYKRYGPLYKQIVFREEGSFHSKRLRCRFNVTSHLDQVTKLRSLRGWKPHIIMSQGLASDGKPRPMGVGYDNFPRASEDKIILTEYTDNSGQASYPLVKAHGCLMILAWVLFSSVGFLLAKYYQPMWPEKRIYDRKYWFAGHFKAMTMVFILVVIAVILIFIEAGGYTYARDLPYKAHPILGIIIFVCVLILPFIALLRPGKGNDCRNVFNWLYWIFATIANVLAIPNIFIGMNFGKASVPWWATWILVFWVIFHIIVEITLEIHQCVTHKKNKERRKKYESLKRDYPKKQDHFAPEPAGRRFKRFMLMLHLAITILVTLIMVIVIAVS